MKAVDDDSINEIENFATFRQTRPSATSNSRFESTSPKRREQRKRRRRDASVTSVLTAADCAPYVTSFFCVYKKKRGEKIEITIFCWGYNGRVTSCWDSVKAGNGSRDPLCAFTLKYDGFVF